MQKYVFFCFLIALISCSIEHSDGYEKVATNAVSIAENYRSEESLAVSGAKLFDSNLVVRDTLSERLLAFGLIDVQELNPNIRVELKYSTTDNFIRTNVYGNFNKALLQKKAAEMLAKAQEYLTEKDSTLFLLVYDAVRPLWVQKKMWNMLDTIPVSQRSKFVSNPKNHSIHNYGAAVDLTICTENGTPLDMGAGFDDPREIAYPSKESHYLAQGLLTQEHIENRLLLREVMKKAGFRVLPTEWWHFNAMSRDEAKRKYKVIP